MKVTVLWDAVPCSLVDDNISEETCYYQLPWEWREVSLVSVPSNQTAQSYIPEDSTLEEQRDKSCRQQILFTAALQAVVHGTNTYIYVVPSKKPEPKHKLEQDYDAHTH